MEIIITNWHNLVQVKGCIWDKYILKLLYCTVAMGLVYITTVKKALNFNDNKC